MKTRTQFLPLAALAGLAIATGSAGAATILTGVVPTSTNSAVPVDHGSNASATPTIALNWAGNWDQYTNWDGRGDAYQIENASVASPVEIVLTPDPGYAVNLVSFDLDEWVGGGNTTLNWTIYGSTSDTLASGTWDDFSIANDPADAGGRSTIRPNLTGADGEALTLSFAQTRGSGTYLAMDNLTFDQVLPAPDTTPPTVLDIIDDKSGGPILDTETVVYTVTFSEVMNSTMLDAGDFEITGSPAATIDSVTATRNPAVFKVTVSPESGAGTLQLQIKSSADIQDLSGNVLLTTPLIADSEVIVVSVYMGLTLEISPNGPNFDFSWFSRKDKYYDLLSITDLATQPSTWTVYDNGVTLYDNIVPSGLTGGWTVLSGVPFGDPRRFFMLQEKDLEGRILRVLSWNIWSADANYAKINEVIQTTGADVIGFQELGRVGSVVRSLETATGENWHSHGMITSRFPIIGTSGAGALIQITPEQTAWVFNVHFAPYPYQPYDLRDGRLAQNEAVVVAAAESVRGGQADSLVTAINNSGAMDAGVPVFVTGDFNEPSHLDWTQEATDATVRPYDLKVEYPASKKMTTFGLIDAFRTVWPDEVSRTGYTWTPGTPPPNVGATEVHDRIDFVYYWGTDVTAIDAVTVGIDDMNPNTDIAIPGYPSDHRAVLGTFVLPETRE
jgi:exonuclease III